MARIQEEILDAFYEKLSASENIGPTMVEKLRKLFTSGEKVKADDFVTILSKERKTDSL